MAARMPEKLRLQRYAHYATNSPLKPSRDDIFDAAMKAKKQIFRSDFVLDGVRSNMLRSSVIPSYNAYDDRHSQVYFRSPRVQAMLKRAGELGKGQVTVGVTNFKLSKRQRIPGTAGKEHISHKENRFVIDSVRTDSLKTKRKPIIPTYDALQDVHSQNYFKKKSVKSLVKRTLDVKI